MARLGAGQAGAALAARDRRMDDLVAEPSGGVLRIRPRQRRHDVVEAECDSRRTTERSCQPGRRTTICCSDRLISPGSRPIRAHSASRRRTRSARKSKSLCGGPLMFQMSAVSAIRRIIRLPQPPISSGGPGRWIGFGSFRFASSGVVPAVEVEDVLGATCRAGSRSSRAIGRHPPAAEPGSARTPRTPRWPGCRRRCRRRAGRLMGAAGTEPHHQRPPEITSSVLAILPSTAGGRIRLLVTSSPRRRRSSGRRAR